MELVMKDGEGQCPGLN